MNNTLEKFFSESQTTVEIDVNNPHLTYDEWKILCRKEEAPKGYYKHPVTGQLRKDKTKKNSFIVQSKKNISARDEYILKQKILDLTGSFDDKGKPLRTKACHNCGQEFPRIAWYGGEKLHFWPANPSNGKDGMRNFCGKWGTVHEIDGEKFYGCDTYRDRLKYISPENPTGIRRGGESDYEKRMQDQEKLLRRKVSECRTKDPNCDVPLEWAIEQAKKQDNLCARTKHKFDYTHFTKDQGTNIYAPSIDRINSQFPHTTWNCQLVCLGYNLLKRDSTDEIAQRFIKEAPFS